MDYPETVGQGGDFSVTPVQLIGITGNMGAGKSTFAAMLARRGALVVDADQVAHEVLEYPEVVEAVTGSFGCGVLNASGRVDRMKLGRVVFSDPGTLQTLTLILRPLLEPELWMRVDACRRATTEPGAVILDAPLILEWGVQDRLDLLVAMVADASAVDNRLISSRGTTAEEIARRTRAQAPTSDKVAAADIVVHNSGTLTELEQAADDLWKKVTH